MRVVVKSEAVMRERGCMCGGIVAGDSRVSECRGRLWSERVRVRKRELGEASLVLAWVSGCA